MASHFKLVLNSKRIYRNFNICRHVNHFATPNPGTDADPQTFALTRESNPHFWRLRQALSTDCHIWHKKTVHMNEPIIILKWHANLYLSVNRIKSYVFHKFHSKSSEWFQSSIVLVSLSTTKQAQILLYLRNSLFLFLLVQGLFLPGLLRGRIPRLQLAGPEEHEGQCPRDVGAGEDIEHHRPLGCCVL